MKVRHVEVRTGAKRCDKKTVVVEYRSHVVSATAATPIVQTAGSTYFATDHDSRRDTGMDNTRLTVSLQEAAKVSRVRRDGNRKRNT